MRTAAEWYHVPLQGRTVFVVAGVILTLRQGLAATVSQLRDLDAHQLKAVARALEIQHPETMVAILSAAWHRAKGKPLPGVDASLLERLDSPEIASAGASAPRASESRKKPVPGARAYCRELIVAGEADPGRLLAGVKKRFPESPMHRGDVLQQLTRMGRRT